MLFFQLSSSTVWHVPELKIMLVLEFSYTVYSELAGTWLSALTGVEKPCLIIPDSSSCLLVSFDFQVDCGEENDILVCSIAVLETVVAFVAYSGLLRRSCSHQ